MANLIMNVTIRIKSRVWRCNPHWTKYWRNPTESSLILIKFPDASSKIMRNVCDLVVIVIFVTIKLWGTRRDEKAQIVGTFPATRVSDLMSSNSLHPMPHTQHSPLKPSHTTASFLPLALYIFTLLNSSPVCACACACGSTPIRFGHSHAFYIKTNEVFLQSWG